MIDEEVAMGEGLIQEEREGRGARQVDKQEGRLTDSEAICPIEVYWVPQYFHSHANSGNSRYSIITCTIIDLFVCISFN